MSQVVESIRLVDGDNLPQELAGFESLGRNESGHLVGIFENGETKGINQLGSLLMKTLVGLGAAEQMASAEISPEAQAIIDSLQARNNALEADKAELERKLTDLQGQVDDLRGVVDGLQKQLEASGKNLDDQLKEEFGENWYPHQREAVMVEQPGLSKEGWTVISERPWKNDQGEWFVKVTNGEDIEEIPVGLVKPQKVPANPHQPVARNRYEPRETLLRRLRNRTRWADADKERTYYVDDRGPYYLDNDEPVYVSYEEVEGRPIGATALVAAGVVGFAVGELIEHTFWGGNSTSQLRQMVHDQSVQINSLNNHLTAVDHHIHNELWHDHKHELRKIYSLQKQVHNWRMSEASEDGSGLKNHLQDTGAYWSFRYPWDWAANKVGTYRAESWLHTLSAKAAEHGHKIRWILNGYAPNGSKREILQVDGSTNTQRVVDILSRYR